MFAHEARNVKADLGRGTQRRFRDASPWDHPAVVRMLPIATAATLALAGCGVTTDVRKGEEPAGNGAEARAARVVQDWVTALNEGDVERAASYFAIPSVAENGPSVVRIDDRGDAVLFNRSLPCGAELIRTEGEGDFVLATFRLGERPGPGTCGAGSGARARTSFKIEDGKIAIWQRVPVGEGGGGEPLPSDVV
jgi:hypothetical protein